MTIEANSIKRIDCSEIQNCFSFWDFEKNIEKRKRIEFEVENNIRIMYAYILNKRYIAGMSLRPMDNRTMYLSYLAVNEEYRNQGIGSEMIRYACQTSKNIGFSYLILNVDHDNTRAGSLYKKLGFSEFKNDGKTIVMCKQLDYSRISQNH